MANNNDWTAWRDEFPILARKSYLNSCSLGALSTRAVQRVQQFQDEWHEYGASAWYERWLGRLDELRAAVAGMLNAPPREIALAPSVSGALTVIGSTLDYAGRPDVVVADLDFPTLAYQWMARPGANVVRVPSDDGATVDPQRFADAVSERTALIATSHVFFTTGAIQDLKALADIAHRAGALLLVDAYQSAGQVPVDVREADVDVLITGPLKWLLGGPGLAYMYVRESLLGWLRPTVAGWFAHRRQFDFDIEHLELRDDARRYEQGTPALPTVHAALGGQSIIDEIGVDAIRERNRFLTDRLIGLAHENDFDMRIAPRPQDRSAIVMIAADDPHAAVAHLAEHDIIVDARPGYVRVSPHFYNTESEIEQMIVELARWRDG
ncbi:MAG TPA: aminotransferase class V-fold PLP-dependent enzyme [Longimicrobiales bacterium]|nr:aminotransferase class V-fold PLP-dependent enzyme [Longimicrobiales bacterium]